MAEQVDKMQPAQLLEELRARVRRSALMEASPERDAENKRADLLEQEILRRMAW